MKLEMRQMNHSFQEIGSALLKAERVLLLTHVNMDGDTLGSAAALCHALRAAGRECWVLIEERVPDNLLFLSEGVCTNDENTLCAPDVCVAVDCSDLERLGNRRDLFLAAPIKICVDHHLTNEQGFADLNYIRRDAAATGEIVYRLLCEVERLSGKKLIGKACAEAMYAAIVTDTGNFQYSSTTRETHEITAELFDRGIEHTPISIKLYQSMRAEKLKVQSKILDTMELFCDGKANIAYVNQAMLAETGADMNETEGSVEQLRNIRGIEISAFLKENAECEIKVSLRAKSWGNVSLIASQFGGGGHEKAAGCTIRKPLSEAMKLIQDEITKQLAGTAAEV